jgi:hypothetical protein
LPSFSKAAAAVPLILQYLRKRLPTTHEFLSLTVSNDHEDYDIYQPVSLPPPPKIDGSIAR